MVALSSAGRSVPLHSSLVSAPSSGPMLASAAADGGVAVATTAPVVG